MGGGPWGLLKASHLKQTVPNALFTARTFLLPSLSVSVCNSSPSNTSYAVSQPTNHTSYVVETSSQNHTTINQYLYWNFLQECGLLRLPQPQKAAWPTPTTPCLCLKCPSLLLDNKLCSSAILHSKKVEISFLKLLTAHSFIWERLVHHIIKVK